MKNKPYPHNIVPQFTTISELLELTKNKYGEKIIFRTKKKKGEESVSYNRLYDDVMNLATYFHKTYGERTRIAVIGENSYEWILTYFAVVCSNNIIVPIDKELASADIAELLKDCEATVFVYSKDYDDIADDLGDLMPALTCINMKSLKGYIESVDEAKMVATDKDAPAAIIYTSGTTGKSKGVILSQYNLCKDTVASSQVVEFRGKTLALLPFHHTYAFTVTVMCVICNGIDTFIASSLKNVMELINDFKPTYLAVVPMIVEKVDKGILQKIEKSGKKKLLGVLDKVCKPFDALGIGLRNKCFSAIRNGLGGELDFIISGGAPIDQQIIDRFDSYGIKIMNGYGISECSPVVSVNRRYHYRAGSIGQALPEVKVKIDNPDENGEGEICVQGDIVMLGYYNMPEETEKAIIDGWFHTGDLGKIDKDGFIYITGRIKNLIILSNGKNVSPEELETLIGRLPGVVECLVSEDDNKLVAEIYPDEEFRATQSDIQAYFDEQIGQLNDTLPPYKAIAKVIIRDTEFVKTTTKKIKRTYTK
ncbi:MAG: long-chain fatty acid--CoA ligase [Ruminococcaceae bacterium]|nr:long-chain fatty acid--CoA ligase [Oscillospiraceae bacterium]